MSNGRKWDMKLKNKKKLYLSIFLFVIRISLSLIFIAASYHKITDPAGFAKIIYGYSIFPSFSINILAIIVPFIELLAGICLLFNIMPEGALILINCLVSGFIIIVGFNLLRGHEFDCGCFSFTEKASFQDNLINLIRNILILTAGIFLKRLSRI